jgi:hypothetical protein
MMGIGIPGLILIFVIAIYLINSIKILREYERGVVFRLGRILPAPKGPGVISSFVPSIRWCASLSARKCSRCRRRTLLPATT